MGRIQSSIGLITGTDIGGTVDQLVALSGRPRDRLVNSTTLLQQEQQSLAELTAAVIGVQLAGQKLANTSTFRSKTATSSNSDADHIACPCDHSINELTPATLYAIHMIMIVTQETFKAVLSKCNKYHTHGSPER